MAAKGKSTSKFRFIEGVPFQNRDWYNDVRVGSASVEANLIKSNSKYFAVPWVTPGSVAVVSLDQKGALDPETLPLIVQDEQMPILEFAFNPFDDNMLVTSAEDGRAFVWKWPENCDKHVTSPVAELAGHEKRLLFCDFHPKVEGVVITADAGKNTKIWDVSQGGAVEKLALPNDYKGLITSVTWNGDGSLMATSCKDKFLRIFDPRANQVVAKVADHQGAKSGRAVWCGRLDRILTTGFSKAPINREMHLWDPRSMGKFIAEKRLDQSSSLSLPLFDEDTSVLYLNGKGEGLINFFELGESSFDHLGKYQSIDPASGVAAFPKTSMDVMKCEIFRLLKLTPKGQVIPIKFSLPRADSMFFQDDIYPNTWDRQPLAAAGGWFGGANGQPNLISLDPTE
jgi:coronin-1B/1C/6